ncbi:hypothetical protein H4582DRAFT_522065 [Lactarius indigo]|nr:hypothetical protein H4582DRAFT_522065 [Lactarius indigo]
MTYQPHLTWRLDLSSHRQSKKRIIKVLLWLGATYCSSLNCSLSPSHFSTLMAGSSDVPSASLDVIRAASPLLFGPLFNWTLYGILCVQIYVYSYNFPIDGRSIKFTAYFVFVLETAQTALTGADMYYWFIGGFGNVERLSHSHFAPIDIAIVNAIIELVVQGYFCYRIWVLNKRSLWLCVIIAVCAVIQAVAAIWLGITSLKVGKYVLSKAGLYLWSIPSAFADILIAVAMTLQLRKASSDFSNFVLIRVVRLTVETNALTAAMAITSLVLYAAFPNEVYYVYITAIIGKLYSNTLLASLNNRIYFRDRRSSVHGIRCLPLGFQEGSRYRDNIAGLCRT